MTDAHEVATNLLARLEPAIRPVRTIKNWQGDTISGTRPERCSPRHWERPQDLIQQLGQM